MPRAFVCLFVFAVHGLLGHDQGTNAVGAAAVATALVVVVGVVSSEWLGGLEDMGHI